MGGKGSGGWNIGKKSPWTSKRNLTNNPCKKGMFSGEKHPLWKGGKSRKYSQKKFNYMKTNCSRCSSIKNLCIHHKDRNPENNVIENIEILCKSCHQKEHKTGFWPKPREKTKQTCVYCGNIFDSPKCRKRKFCSKSCYFKSKKVVF